MSDYFVCFLHLSGFGFHWCFVTHESFHDFDSDRGLPCSRYQNGGSEV